MDHLNFRIPGLIWTALSRHKQLLSKAKSIKHRLLVLLSQQHNYLAEKIFAVYNRFSSTILQLHI